jgi:hypothetical protein
LFSAISADDELPTAQVPSVPINVSLATASEKDGPVAWGSGGAKFAGLGGRGDTGQGMTMKIVDGD